MKAFTVLLVGVILGAASWAICPMVSSRAEPFDTSLGLALGQSAMAMFMAYVGWQRGLLALLAALFGLYAGQIGFIFLFGSDEMRAWLALGLITAALLCIVPLAGGLLCRGIAWVVEDRTD